MTPTPTDAPDWTARDRLGIASLVRAAYAGHDLGAVQSALLARIMADGGAQSGALMDLSILMQLQGRQDEGLRMQRRALDSDRLYRTAPAPERPRLRVLALAAPLDMGGNTPLDFLIGGKGTEIRTLYIDADARLPETPPEHDVAIVTAPAGEAAGADLRAIAAYAARFETPVLNAPHRIAALDRDHLSARLRDIPGLYMPETVRIRPSRLKALAGGLLRLDDIFAESVDWPLIARPTESQAGRGLERIENAEAFTGYMERVRAGEYFIAPLIDYRSTDGFYRKQRIVFIDGTPFPVHMAIGETWSLWYLNAQMAEDAERRADEQAFFETFDTGFARRHGAALRGLADRIGLEYFGIDCAESPDGRLLVFEADNALIVHDMDPPALFPYKVRPMRRLFEAFRALCAGARALPAVARRGRRLNPHRRLRISA